MKRVFFFAVIIASVFVINSLIRSIYTLSQKQDLIVDVEKEMIKQKQKNQRLKSELSYVESEEFIEEAARNKLLLVKPGEQEVLIPKDLIKNSSSPSANVRKDEPNWKKWLKLFF